MEWALIKFLSLSLRLKGSKSFHSSSFGVQLSLFELNLFGLNLFGLNLFGLNLFGLNLFGLNLFGLSPTRVKNVFIS